MDGIYPTSDCKNMQFYCNTGGTWVSNTYIRNRGQTSFPTMGYDEGYPDYLTNNSPPTPMYVRLAVSQRDPNKKVFWINGWERPRLILTRGKKYQFNVVTCGEPFFLTSDQTGGNGAVGGVSSVPPSDFYVYTYTINPTTPMKFYYQSPNTADIGGQVIIQ